MNKLTLKQARLAKLLTLGGVGLATFLPLAIVVACGEADTPTPTTPTSAEIKAAAAAFLNAQVKPKVVADAAASKPVSVVWNDMASLPKVYNDAYEAPAYSIGLFASPDDAAKDSSTWTTTLPTSIANQKKARHLWVRLVHRTDPSLSVALEITSDSKIGDISEVDVKSARAFLTGTFTQRIKVDVVNSTSIFVKFRNEIPLLPTELANTYSGIEFSIDFDFKGEGEAEVNTDASLWKMTYPTSTKADINERRLWARLIPKNAQASHVAVELTESSELKKVGVPEIYTKALAFLNSEVTSGAVVTAAATPGALTWVKTASLPADLVDEYSAPEYSTKYYGGNDVALKDAKPSDWSTSLPNSVVESNNERYLWVRIKHKVNDNLSLVREITETSNIKKIKASEADSRAKAQRFLDEEVKDKVKVVEGSTLSNVTFTGLPTLPADFSNYVIEYNISNFLNGEQALQALTGWAPNAPRNSGYPIDLTRRKLWVRLKHVNSEYSAVLEISGSIGLNLIVDAEAYLKEVVTSSIKAEPTSLSNNVVYTSTPSALPREYADVFNAIEYSQVNDSAASNWSTTLPTSFPNAKADRNLFARLVSKKTSAATVFDVAAAQTFEGRIRSLLYPDQAKNALAVWTNLIPFRIIANNTDKRLVTATDRVSSSYPTPDSSVVAVYSNFEFSSYNFASDTDAIANVNDVGGWASAIPTRYDLRKDQRALWVRLASKFPDKTPTLVLSLTTASRIREMEATTEDFNFVVDQYEALLKTIKAASGSTYANVSWTNSELIALPAELSEDYGPLYFSTSYSFYPVFNNLPTSFDVTPSERHLAARLERIKDKNPNTEGRTIRLDQSSGILDLP